MFLLDCVFNNEFEGNVMSLYSDYVVKSSDKERYLYMCNIMFHGWLTYLGREHVSIWISKQVRVGYASQEDLSLREWVGKCLQTQKENAIHS